MGISHLESIRQAIHDALGQMGCDLKDLHEAILIRQGMYCGRRFECDKGSAVWFIEENQVKYFSAEGELLNVVTVPAAPPLTPRRRAA
jgi:hypothetical protein